MMLISKLPLIISVFFALLSNPNPVKAKVEEPALRVLRNEVGEIIFVALYQPCRWEMFDLNDKVLKLVDIPEGSNCFAQDGKIVPDKICCQKKCLTHSECVDNAIASQKQANHRRTDL